PSVPARCMLWRLLAPRGLRLPVDLEVSPQQEKEYDDRGEWQRGRLSGVPWEDAYGYAQAVKIGDTIYVSGQLSHDDKGTLIAPAALDESGKPSDYRQWKSRCG